MLNHRNHQHKDILNSTHNGEQAYIEYQLLVVQAHFLRIKCDSYKCSYAHTQNHEHA